MLTILNTSILTNYGSYHYSPLSLTMAQLHSSDAWEREGGILSAVGHQSTADILTELLGVPVPVNRIEYSQRVGDAALIFKLKGRPPEGKILSRDEIEAIGYEFGLLVREA